MDVDLIEEEAIIRLKKIRESRKLSQLELSMKSGVSQNMIAYIESNKRHPTMNTIIKLCVAMNVNPSVLFVSDDTDRTQAKELMHKMIDTYFV